MSSDDKSQPPPSREAAVGQPDPAVRLSELLAKSLEELTGSLEPSAKRSRLSRALEAARPAETIKASQEAQRRAEQSLFELEAKLSAAARVIEKAPSPLPPSSLPHVREIENQLRAVRAKRSFLKTEERSTLYQLVALIVLLLTVVGAFLIKSADGLRLPSNEVKVFLFSMAALCAGFGVSSIFFGFGRTRDANDVREQYDALRAHSDSLVAELDRNPPRKVAARS